MKLTEAEELVLISIHDYIEENEQSPTMRDIANDLGKSVSTIYHHLLKLKEKGYINFKEKKQRTTTIL